MINKKLTLLLALAVAVCLTGCGKKDEEIKQEIPKEESVVVEEEKEVQEETEEVETFAFTELDGLTFYFASGAGGWRTELAVAADGSFEGSFTDSEMGSVGEDYPNGTFYYCNFEGKFSEAVKVNDFTYTMSIENLSYFNEPGETMIVDGILYYAAEATGLVDAEEVLLYLPGAPTAELPEEYMGWVRYGMEDPEDAELPFYGLYNVTVQNGFSSYVAVEETEYYVLSVEEQSDALKYSLENDPLTQTEMNEKSKELYDLWDGELNRLWGELKNSLSEEAFEELLAEQRVWIADKEAAVEEAGKEVEGGSIYPLVVNSTAAQLTEERVYELLEWLP